VSQTRAFLRTIFRIYVLVLAQGQIHYFYSNGLLLRDSVIIDFFQYWLTLICVIILLASFYGSYENLSIGNPSILRVCLILNLGLVIVLLGTRKIFYFFIIFEVSVLPIFIIILGWGYQPEKINAAYALFFFTVVLAAPLVIILLLSFSYSLNLDRSFLDGKLRLRYYRSTQGVLILAGFLVKMPLYGVHFWLPLAHVEAPVYGSMILAGILLKLGGIGILRFFSYLRSLRLNNFLALVRLFGILLVGRGCLFITDLKKIIAFSSIAHIGLAISLLVFKFHLGVWVAYLILIVHAFRSSAIFFVVYYFYLITNSRNLLINMGLLRLHPIIRFFWLMAIIARLGAPPAINLLAEIWALIIRFIVLFKYSLIIISSFILGSVYHFILYSTIIQGVTLWQSINLSPNSFSVGVYIVSRYHRAVTFSLVRLIRWFVI